ncbi:uncharacterized protein LOC123535978 [Mercenaria mercenaria]|uniref:uncharacterized protein LOC123535978 n=1 Tax=Mercenaria mercenaria TaxID=6596 RepID=UPI00234E6636|nr:uncharacterized protein LOC123535978 [Mercenaria mercenaria]
MAVPGRKTSDLADSMLKGSGEDFDHKCDPCLTDDQHVEAHGFCVNCHEYLCRNCFKFHQRTKALKHHELLDKVSMAKKGVSTAVSTTEVFTERCMTHENEVIKFFCPTHEALGCTDCITMDHRACKIDYIPDKCADIGDSEEYRDIMKKLDRKVKEAEDVRNKAEVREKEIDAQYQSVLNDIAKFRKEINDRLDQLQTKITEVANKRKSQDKQIVKEAVDTCTNISSDVKKLQTSLQDSKSSNQNGQLYITIKRAKSKIKSDEIKMMEQSLEKVNVQYKYEKCRDLEKMLSKPDGFGKLSFTANIASPKKEESSKSLTFIDEINVKAKSDKTFFKCDVSGCAALSSNKIVLIDGTNNNKLKVVDTDSKAIVQEKVIDPPPSGIAALPHDQIAVTVQGTREILMMTTAHKIATVRRIKVKERCRDVTYCQDRLYVLCTDPNCILTVDMQGKVVDTIPLENEVFQGLAHIICSKNAELLYVSDSGSNSIVSVTLKGQITAIYQNTELCSPKGMVILDDGSLLVCCYINHTIHRISGDLHEGQKVQEDVKNTCSICYNREQQKLYITSINSNLLKVFILK